MDLFAEMEPPEFQPTTETRTRFAREMKTMRIALTAILGLFLTVPAMAAVEIDTLPRNGQYRWIYQALDDLYNKRILLGKPTHCWGTEPVLLNRYEAAIAAYAASTVLHDLARDLTAARNEVSQSSAPLTETQQKLKDQAVLVRSNLAKTSRQMRDLLVFFGPELKVLEVDTAERLRYLSRDTAILRSYRFPQPGEAHIQFPDVPAAHWAAASIQNLRADGILQGTEKGLFEGGV